MFWDSSALVPWLFPEPRSGDVTTLLGWDRQVVIWWATPVECQSAIHRRQREAILPAPFVGQVLERLAALIQDAHTVAPTYELRRRAGQLLATHPIRAGDSFQLAAALDWCAEQATGETFVCLDHRLRDAARREGFAVLPG